MKCEKCEKIASFHYKSDINGEKTEYHLCNDCAKAEGFGETLERAFSPAYNSFWGNPYSLMGSFFSDSPVRLMPRIGAFAPVMAPPWVNIFIGDGEKATKPEERAADNIPIDAGQEIRSKRELSALKHQLRQAVRAEEYEKAAVLRDKIREMEK